MEIARNRIGLYVGCKGFYETGDNWRRELSIAKDLGVGVVRFNADAWDVIQPTAKTFDFTVFDAIVDGVASYGLDLVFTTPISAKWNRPATADSHTPTVDLRAVSQMVTAVASRYRGAIKYYEAWNEPDYPPFWKPAPDAAAYLEYLRVVSAAVRREDPAAKVLNGGLAMPSDPAFMTALREGGLMDLVDAVNIHIYPAYASPFTAMETVEGVFGAGVPVIVTETSSTGARFDTADTVREERAKCAWLARSYQSLLSRPNVLAVIWHCLRNPLGQAADGTVFEYDFGLLKNDWMALPAFTAHKVFTENMDRSAVLNENAEDILGVRLTAECPIYVMPF